MKEMLVGHNGSETILVFSGHIVSEKVWVSKFLQLLSLIHSMTLIESCIHLSYLL